MLIHGYPETHIAWRKVAGDLARKYTVIAPDLPGYGASRPTSTDPRWTKRRVGEALVTLMRALGHQRFAVVGHDRGARDGYRLVLDHPGVVTAFASLAIVPTLDALAGVDHEFARKNYHWFLLSQPNGLPERLLAAAPDAVIDWRFDVVNAADDSVIEPAARAAYRAAFRDPSVRHAQRLARWTAPYWHCGRRPKPRTRRDRTTYGDGGPTMSWVRPPPVTTFNRRIALPRS